VKPKTKRPVPLWVTGRFVL